MRTKMFRKCTVALLLSMACGVALAQDAPEAEEDAGGFSWNAALTSEYMFRGISQTDDHPALQLGADYAFGNGFYAGVWGSSVDFGEGTDAEIDTFVGWGTDLSDSTALDVMLTRYNYVGEPSSVDYAYNELIGTLEFNETYTVTLGYTNDYLNSSENSIYLGVGGGWEVGGGVNLSANVGYTDNSGDIPSYMDYSVGVDREFGPINAALQYVGTNADAEELFGEDNAEDKFVLTFSYGL